MVPVIRAARDSEPAMVPMTRAARDSELDGEDAPSLSCFVVEHEPDTDIPDGELAW